MANKKIDLRPAGLDLALYAGDGATIKLKAVQSEEEDADPINLSGDVSAQIRANRPAPDPALLEFDVDMTDAVLGIVILILSDTQTRSLLVGGATSFVGVWDIQWTPTGSQPRTIIQGKVECGLDVTR